jgi:hypothetical protein
MVIVLNVKIKILALIKKLALVKQDTQKQLIKLMIIDV